MKRDLSEDANGISRGAGGPTGLFARLECAVQRGFGDLERPANLRNRVSLLIEILGNNELPCGKGFWSPAFFPSRSGCSQTCLGSFPDQVSFKLRKSAKDMEDQFSAAGGELLHVPVYLLNCAASSEPPVALPTL
jgi:hypothetical protein